MNQNEMPWNDPTMIITQTEPKGPPATPEPAASDPSPPEPDPTEGSLTIQDVRDTLTLTKEGRVMQTMFNCEKALLLDPVVGGKLRRNMLTGRIDLIGEVPWNRGPDAAFTDTDLHEIESRFEQSYGLRPGPKIQNTIDVVANQLRYHPILDKLHSLVWDGRPRVRNMLHHFLGAENSEFTQEVTLLMMRAAIKRLEHPGCKYDQMVCFIGDQGAGKSTFFRFLALEDEWFSDDLKCLDDKKIYEKLQGHWIIEMSEMLTLANSKSIEEIKSFLSRQKETHRVAYGRYPQDYRRTCVFVGTTNSMEFLPVDRSGNRRFIPVLIDPSQAEVHILEDEEASRAYIRQAWAEMMQIYERDKGAPLCLPKHLERQLPQIQQQFMPEDSKAGIIRDWMANTAPEYICGLMVWREALGEASQPRNYELKEIGDIIRHTPGWEPVSSHRFGGVYGTQRAYKRSGDGFQAITPEMEKDLPFDLGSSAFTFTQEKLQT